MYATLATILIGVLFIALMTQISARRSFSTVGTPSKSSSTASHTINVGPIKTPPGKKVVGWIVHCLYTVAYTTSGNDELLNHQIDGFEGRCNGQRKIYGEKRCLTPMAKLTNAMLELLPGRSNWEQYVDGNPTTTVAQHAYWIIGGNFMPGVWDFVIKLKASSDAFDTTTAYASAWKIIPIYADLTPGDKFNLLVHEYVSALEHKFESALAFMYEFTISNLSNLQIAGDDMSSDQLDTIKRAWATMMGGNWDDTVSTTDIGYTLNSPQSVVLKASASIAGGAVGVLEDKGYTLPKKIDQAEVYEVDKFVDQPY